MKTKEQTVYVNKTSVVVAMHWFGQMFSSYHP